MWMALRHVLAILLLPTMVTIVVPRWILTALASGDSRWPADGWSWVLRTLGVLLILAGLSLLTWCISLFVRVGKGTLAPWDPTSNLVAVGPYRYTRNPMITGVCTILIGEAVLFGSWRLGLWALMFIGFNHIHFLLIEEPGLEERFGEPYLEYKRTVPRWIPRVHRRSAA
jgi:protein-S-isoprenylcysteine O-methyltransferase Ste14